MELLPVSRGRVLTAQCSLELKWLRTHASYTPLKLVEACASTAHNGRVPDDSPQRIYVGYLEFKEAGF